MVRRLGRRVKMQEYRGVLSDDRLGGGVQPRVGRRGRGRDRGEYGNTAAAQQL